MIRKGRVFLGALALFAGAFKAPLGAQSTLLFLELQAVAAYSSASGSVELFSLMPHDAMQKPGVGFDLVHRVSGRTRDIGVLAVQARLAYDQKGETKLEPQLYNAYFRWKAGFADLWAGHNRPAIGLSYGLDSHPLLLPAPPMMGFGFDRDWGAGLHRDVSWGDVALSVTTGSGMTLHLKGHYLLAARVSRGVAARDNYSFGLSAAHGRVLDAMGTELMDPEPFPWTAAGIDATHFWRNVENRAEVLIGRRAGEGALLLFWRTGLNLLEEGRLKIEAQPAIARTGEEWRTSLASGLTFLVNADLAGRFMVHYDRGRRDARFVFQLYYYKGL